MYTNMVMLVCLHIDAIVSIIFLRILATDITMNTFLV